MFYPREFFQLQLAFAQRVHALQGIPLEKALLGYTNLYVRLGCGRKFDHQNDRWRAFLSGLPPARQQLDYICSAYVQNAETNTSPQLSARVGCFSYSVHDASCVRLHFQSDSSDTVSPLHPTRIERRRDELVRLLKCLAQTQGDDVEVVGTSWLYNLDAYRRLFPPAYVSSAKAVERFCSMPLWGQFVDWQGQIKKSRAQRFLQAVSRQSTFQGLVEQFPLKPLAVHAPAGAFRGLAGLGG